MADTDRILHRRSPNVYADAVRWIVGREPQVRSALAEKLLLLGYTNADQEGDGFLLMARYLMVLQVTANDGLARMQRFVLAVGYGMPPFRALCEHILPVPTKAV